MTNPVYDIAVLGAGPAGYGAAIRAAQMGKKVALIEKEKLGGVCLNEGCIPTKTFLDYVEVLENINKAETWGINVELKGRDFNKFLERKDSIIHTLANGLKKILLSHKIEIYYGEGVLSGTNTIEIYEISGKKLHCIEASKIIIAAGSRPKSFPLFDFSSENIITSSQALKLKKLPKEIVILGGGVIGCEFASIYSGLGVKVILIEKEGNLLPSDDGEIARRLEGTFRERNIEIHTAAKVEKIEKLKDLLHIELSNGKSISGEKILLALGRVPNTNIKGIDKLNLISKEGKIKVNERMQTNLKGVYGAGDILGEPFLAHWALQQGIIAAENASGKNAFMKDAVIPYCVYTRPEIGRVGLTEREARQKGFNIRVGRYSFAALSRAVIKGERQGLFKIISDDKNDKILGIHIFGRDASDLTGESVLAVKLGLSSKELARIIHAHPTFNEGIRSAAEDVNKESIYRPRHGLLGQNTRKR